MRNQVFFGSGVALVTPFCLDKSVDYTAFEVLVKRQISSGTNALIVAATTGEGSSLSNEEKGRLTSLASRLADKKLPVIMGVSANTADNAVKQAKMACECGANAVLIPTPYFIRTSQSGIIEYFREICEKANLPVIVYDILSRTGMSIGVDTYQKIMKIKNIAGIKDCSGSLEKITAIYKNCGHKISIYSGEDLLNLPIYAVGGCGCISVTANVLPDAVSKCYNHYKDNKIELARRMHTYLHSLSQALFCENNPIPVKYALHKMGLCENVYRSPLTCPNKSDMLMLEKVLANYGII